MESVRVRGCAGEILGSQVVSRQADASRRRNGPRKAPRGLALGRRSRCGLEVSPAPRALSDTALPGEKAGSGREAARASAGGCGVEDQVGRTGFFRPVPPVRPTLSMVG